MLELIRQSALELEMAEHLGAQPYERTGGRLGYRNGYKPRMLYTAVGTLNLLVPQDRDGTFSTALFERYQRSDKALVLAMMETYVKGVSTRKVPDIMEQLCGRSFPSQQVSELAALGFAPGEASADLLGLLHYVLDHHGYRLYLVDDTDVLTAGDDPGIDIPLPEHGFRVHSGHDREDLDRKSVV